jgi:phospholipid transport system substrate-binding protein
MLRFPLPLLAALMIGIVCVPVAVSARSAPKPPIVQAALQAAPLPTADAGQFIQAIGDRATAILADKTITQSMKDKTFQDLMHASFDLPTIGRFVIGRNVWQGATSAEQQEYLQLFEQLVIRIYSDRFALYNGEIFKVVGTHAEGERDTIVTSHMIRPNNPQPITIDWRVRAFDGKRLGIIDVVVEGISMSVSQRQEYSSVLAREDNQIAPLLEVMRKQITKDDNRRKGDAPQ